MVVHPFGAVSSPSCANAALKRTADDNITRCEPEAANVIKRNFYVDDCLTSCETEQRAIALIRNVSDLCNQGGFHVTKWISSSSQVLETVSVEERAKGVKDLNFEKDTLPSERALGIQWDVKQDSFGFKVSLKSQPHTRRTILSTVYTVYDPLGFAAPYILTAKILLQDLCARNIGWDDTISDSDLQTWKQWLSQLPRLEEVQISRCYKPTDFGDVKSCVIHVFSDASNKGYGIVSYIRLIDYQGRIHCSFLMGKARVAPLKTIPRMELTAAVVAARMSTVLVKELDYFVNDVVFWTDSTSVLRYTGNETTRFKTFVANRVTEIRDISSPSQWNYVDTKNNSADSASRGVTMDRVLQYRFWIEGPTFLWKSETEWPRDVLSNDIEENDLEVKATVSATTTTGESLQVLTRLLNYYSDWTKLKTTVAWLLKAMTNLKNWSNLRKEIQKSFDHGTCTDNVDVQMDHLRKEHLKSCKEKLNAERIDINLLKRAERSLICHTQKQYYDNEIQALQKVDAPKPGLSKMLYKLDPFLQDGVLRVGGRLRRASIPDDAKFPILLPKGAIISRLIITDCHKKTGHLGRCHMLATLRQSYWILRANTSIKKLLSKCTLCRKYGAKAEQQKMSDLPTERLQSDKPAFTCVGMDYFGPIEVKRSRSTVKRYGVLFTCLTTRAVHLEVAYSLDTDSCINSIRRLISRRGAVKYIRSDNGTNLVGSERELREEINQWNVSKIQKTLRQKEITWEFNPPTGSHFGGIWERLIRSTMKILNALLKEQGQRLDDEELQTLLCEIESIMNNRPLTELTDDPNDPQALTPNHLLQQRAGETLPPGLFQRGDNFARRRWRQIQYLADIFWSRWTREYLPLLQSRQKWNHPRRNVQQDDIVLLVDSTPRNAWSLGRVRETYKDSKGLVRSVRVKTKSNVFIRPISKLCLLLEANEC